MVEGGGLESRCGCKSTEGSNPSLSAILRLRRRTRQFRKMAYKLIFYSLIGFIFCSSSYAAGNERTAFGDKLYTCREAELGLKFFCSPDWTVRFDNSADMFVISEEPEVVLTVVREETELMSLEQLTAEYLKALGNYADGFGVERILVDGVNAVKVKAYDRDYHDIRLTDIYVIKQGFLYKIMFSVSPKKEWARYQFLLQKIITSFKFLSANNL